MIRKPWSSLVILLLVALLAIAAACVGESNTPTPIPPTPTPNLPEGSPLAPEQFLTFDGVDYVHNFSADATFVSDRIEFNLDNLEMVGTTYEGIANGISEGLQVYRSTITGDANMVYTFTPGGTDVNPEDGQIFEFPAKWTRWEAQ